MRGVFAALVGMGMTLAGTSQADETPSDMVYTFGIVPQQSASRLAAMWSPFLIELSARTGATFQFQTTKDIPTFEACLASGAYDVAYMNPMHYAVFSKEAAYKAIARQADKRLKGLIVSRKDSQFQTIADLDSQMLAFPSPGAFGASILTRSGLSAQGVAFETSYVNSHDSVYRAVAAGLMAAGGGVTRTFNALDPNVREHLSVIYETDSFTPHAIAVLDQDGKALANEVQGALLAIAQDSPDLVTGIGMRGFEVALDADWDDVRQLGMTREQTGISDKNDILCPLD